MKLDVSCSQKLHSLLICRRFVFATINIIFQRLFVLIVLYTGASRSV